MVNTFLPYPDFVKSAQSLDYKRLGKQRVEAWQILRALRGETKGWRNHPATNLWRGHEKLLCEYGIAICNEWIARGYNDNMRERFVALHSTYPDCELPKWFGNPQFHNSHMSNLNRKDSTYYHFNITNDLPYVWFNNDTQQLYVREEDETQTKKKAKVKK